MNARVTVMVGFGLLAIAAGALLFTEYSPTQANTLPTQVVSQPVFAIESAELPEDGQRYCVSILVHDDWRQRRDESRIVGWWEVHPYLRSVAGQTTYDVYPMSGPRYQRYFAAAIREADLPVVLVQDGSGKVHWKANRTDMPESAEDMAASVGGLFKSRPIYLLPWRRPKPCPQPSPTPEPSPQPTPNDVPIFEPAMESEPVEEPKDSTMPIIAGLLILGGVIGMIGGIVGGVKSRIGN